MRVSLPDGRVAEFPEGMSQQDVLAVMRQKFPPEQEQGALQKYVVDPLFYGVGGGVVERIKGFQQAGASQERQQELGGEIAGMQAQREAKGAPTQIGGVIGRDVLGPLAGALAFSNPLGIGALSTAGGIGALYGATAPTVKPVDTPTRMANAATGAAGGVVGQYAGGLLGRAAEGLMPAAQAPTGVLASAGSKVAGGIGAAAKADEAVIDGLWEAARGEAAGRLVPYSKVGNLQKILMDGQAASGSPLLGSQLTMLNRFIEGGLDVPAETIMQMRQGLSKAARTDGGLWGTVKGFDDVLQNSLKIRSLPKAIDASRNYFQRFYPDNSPLGKIVDLGKKATPEEVLAPVISAGNKAAARNVEDFVGAGAKRSDIRQGLLADAYNRGGQNPMGMGTGLTAVTRDNPTLARGLLSSGDTSAAARASDMANKSTGNLLNFGIGGTGIGGVGAYLYGNSGYDQSGAGGYATPLLAAAGLLAAAKYGGGQYAADEAALAMRGLLGDIGVKADVPGLMSKAAGGLLAGSGVSVGQEAFTPYKKRRKVEK